MEQKKKEPFNFEKMPLKQIPSERLMTPVVIYEDGTTNLKEDETEKTYDLEEVFKMPRQVEMESDYITTIWSDGTTGLKKDKTEKEKNLTEEERKEMIEKIMARLKKNLDRMYKPIDIGEL
jgi:hypothetical protein